MRLDLALYTFQKQLACAGVENPSLDARLLTAHALNCDRVALIANPDRVLNDSEFTDITALINRRAAREPVARIIGQREFWGLPFGLNEATLEPRPDSETLIEAALLYAKECGAPHRILDLGTGTGCLLLALLHEWPHATGLGIDQSERALQQAKSNAAQLGLSDRAQFQKGNWLDGLRETFDLICSNPPYIARKDEHKLAREVKDFDPSLALFGGEDGLEPYRIIIPSLTRHLNKDGAVFFEVGIGQAKKVAGFLHEAGFHSLNVKRDIGNIDRIVSGKV